MREQLGNVDVQHLGQCDQRLQSRVGPRPRVRLTLLKLAVGEGRFASGVGNAFLREIGSSSGSVEEDAELANVADGAR